MSFGALYNNFMLQVKNLSFQVKSERKTRKILDGLNISVKPGELIIITGPNGSGKSTLAKLIAGIEKPTTGQITLNGTDITDQTITERAKLGIAYAFQQPVHFKGITVKDLLQIAATGQETFLEDETGTDYGNILKTIGLDPEIYLSREINNSLSGGELKRIEIASILARKASLTVFDEPEAGIDIWSFDKLVGVFRRLRKQNPETSYIIISHQKRLIEIADRIIVLKDGQIATEGPVAKIIPKLEELL